METKPIHISKDGEKSLDDILELLAKIVVEDVPENQQLISALMENQDDTKS